MSRLTPIKWILGAVLICYPALVYYGLQNYGPRIIAIILLLVVSIRSVINRDHLSVWLWLIALTAAAFSFAGNTPLGLKLYPVLVSATMLGVFTISLLRGPTVIERFARLQEPNLPSEGVKYCRKVTLVWCVFFIFNGIVAALTISASDAVWALYNGLISYIIMGILFAGEYIVRRHTRNNLPNNPTR